MLRPSPLKNILRFRKPKTPGFGISKNFYLTVLAAKAPLPSLAEIVSPKGENDTVPGYGVPLIKGATKESLLLPIERGAYALAAPDQKTVIRMMVMSKEEAGFSPDLCVQMSSQVQMTPEAKASLLSTWSIMQLTLESHHPMVFPAISFLLKVASRLGQFTDGLVADPLSRVYRAPQFVGSSSDDDHAGAPDIVAIHTRTDGLDNYLQTSGMSKFLMPELTIKKVRADFTGDAESLLMDVSQAMLDGHKFTVGERVGPARHGFCVESSILTDSCGIEAPCFEIVASDGRALNDVLAEWSGAKDPSGEQTPGLR